MVAVVLDELQAFGVGVIADEYDRPSRGQDGLVVVRVLREVRGCAARLLLVGVLEVFLVFLVLFVAVVGERLFRPDRGSPFD